MDENTNTQGIVSTVGTFLKDNWQYIVGAVLVAGGAYGAYSFFGSESETTESLDRAINE